MFNQIRRIWSDTGAGDRDFTPQEQRLKSALQHLQEAANSLSKATEMLVHVLETKGLG